MVNIYKEALDDENIIDKLFEYRRILDPVRKCTLEISKDDVKYSAHKCYEFWGKNSECSNCISMRAYNENKSFTKVEYLKDRIYFIMATPIIKNKEKYIVEVLKDITNDNITGCLISKSMDQAEKEIQRLNDLAIIDEVTNIYNRRYINEKTPSDINNAIENQYDLSLAIMDIDDFKIINDTYGHMCGDYILESVSDIIKRNINLYGWVGRYGGDEFVIVMNKTSKLECYEIIEKIRKDIEKALFTYEGKNINVTCSFGISGIDKCINNFNKIIKDADFKLINGKNGKKNIVII
ncbi:GGDEF domain-containing protein [Clostridium sp. CCUG 7971]|uniref:GGDEF domain-containing protein n=1 Tax=Clostridium sp. CCUG 7971 TaxID=2811414 RepID=UPI001ABB8AA8|nr:GGDEF domain-containing protein [Clostridium sp. CCUG 7971]MBO3445828.1 GGDEF domain-containing protein [Clostridium sp. CCUG 7971]